MDGEVVDSYLDNVIAVCHGEKEGEFKKDTGEEYWVTCFNIDKSDSGAIHLAT